MRKTIDVEGLYYDGNNNLTMKKGNVTVRFTSDKIGKTLSLTFDDKHQIAIPFESVEQLFK